VDKVDIVTVYEKAIGYKNVTMNEPHFTGHFPDNPIMPGVLIIEAMAQTAAVLVMASDEISGKDVKEKSVLFIGIDSTKFRKPVVPGDVLKLEVSYIQSRMNVWKMSGIATVDGKKVAESQFSAMIVEKKS
jgi:3-hydroxyacyl-[acyl-carrier-protein] dehydratase